MEKLIKTEIERLNTFNLIDYMTGELPNELIVMILRGLSWGALVECKIWTVSRRLNRIYKAHHNEIVTGRANSLTTGTSCGRTALDYCFLHNNRFLRGKACSMCAKWAYQYCSRCKSHYYCDRACQRRHWKLMHKELCKNSK